MTNIDLPPLLKSYSLINSTSDNDDDYQSEQAPLNATIFFSNFKNMLRKVNIYKKKKRIFYFVIYYFEMFNYKIKMIYD